MARRGTVRLLIRGALRHAYRKIIQITQRHAPATTSWMTATTPAGRSGSWLRSPNGPVVAVVAVGELGGTLGGGEGVALPVTDRGTLRTSTGPEAVTTVTRASPASPAPTSHGATPPGGRGRRISRVPPPPMPGTLPLGGDASGRRWVSVQPRWRGSGGTMSASRTPRADDGSSTT